MGPDRKVKKFEGSDWRASSAILLFSCTPAGQVSPAQFSSISSKWYPSCGNARAIGTKLLRF